jgi:hypothetical protein
MMYEEGPACCGHSERCKSLEIGAVEPVAVSRARLHPFGHPGQRRGGGDRHGGALGHNSRGTLK